MSPTESPTPWTEYTQIEADEKLEDACRQLVRLAVYEDLEHQVDWSTVSTVPGGRRCVCELRTRSDGRAAGLVCIPWILDEMQAEVEVTLQASDGEAVTAGTSVAMLTGESRDVLTAERILLNFVCRLSGIATHTRRFVERIAGTRARVYDTRKTTPGWRRLDKYAVRCGGGANHRTGLFDGFLIKDNHLAIARGALGASPSATLETVQRWLGASIERMKAPESVEIEVDDLAQFDEILPLHPHIILLDNFSLADLQTAVERRNRSAPRVQLEASGGVTLETVRAIAETGVDRVSCGALTHAAPWLDLGLDWNECVQE